MANELMKSHHDVVVEIGTHLLNSEEEYMISGVPGLTRNVQQVCHYVSLFFFLFTSRQFTSTFLDLEASVSRDDEVDSPYKDNDEDFIAEEDSSDGTTGSMTFEVFDRGTASTVAEESQAWTSFLERARSHANELKSSLETDCGWEESVVLHIGRCAQPELGIKAAFITPLVAETGWLFDIPGVVHEINKLCFTPSLPKTVGLEIANEITEKLADQFAQSGHPLVRRSLGILPKVSEWCFQVGEVVTDISKHISGTIFSVGEHELEVEFANGLFPVRWADCKKEFEIGTYVEITGESMPLDGLDGCMPLTMDYCT
ncbi:hypothetical protein EDD18DRAFT_1109606 [Armillaria luteobubalina]|uniref:Uncharacterized protein n=1 Tax=Armillaria luteobubalina TaxID=153913 RepID=A0AA39PWT0_9AGAR|nr:hypothetical protein EDD18DRAFT_1109606 [Armillaria luteobubalina]